MPVRRVTVVMLVVGVVAALAAPVAVGGTSGRAQWLTARLAHAVRAHAVTRAQAEAVRVGMLRAARLERVVPADRARVLARLLRAAEQPQTPITPTSARILAETLAVNNHALALLSGSVRVTHARSGVVYRRYGDNGFQFQPLASFGRLNAALDARETARAHALAAALLARAEPSGGTLQWRYYFGIYGARAGWTSGLVQAVAAQALARAGRLSDARRAFAALMPKLIVDLPQGPWIRLYSFSDDIVLNAQLQAMLSLRQYGARAADPQALRLAAALAHATQRLLPRFDTGWWSRYDLGSGLSPLDYHRYVTSLLWKAARAFGGSVWRSTARRFSDDWRKPPQLTDRSATPAVYLMSGARSVARLGFRLSKPAYVTVRIGDTSSAIWRAAGRHVLAWRPAATTPRSAFASVSATDYAGNRTSTVLPPVRVRLDVTPPHVRAKQIGGVVFSSAHDALSPDLRGLFLFPTSHGWSVVHIAHFRTSGVFASTPVAPAGWLVVADASGNATLVRLANTCGGPSADLIRNALPALRLQTPATLVWVR